MRALVLVAVFLVLAAIWAQGPIRSYWLTHVPVSELETYVVEHPGESDAALQLARRKLAVGAPADAERVLRPLTEQDPANEDAWLLRSQSEFEQGKLAPAYASLKVVLQFSQSAEAYWRLGLLLERRGDEQEAEAAFQKAVELDPKHSGPRVKLARSALAHRHYAPALEHLQGVLKREPRNAEVLELLSLTHRNLGDLNEAAEHARAAVAAAPERPNAWRALGQALQDQATESAMIEAEKAYREALDREPSSDLHHLLGKIYFSRGEYQRAADELQRAVDLHPLNRLPYPNLIQAYHRLGQKRRAEEALREYEKLNEMDLSTAPLEYSAYAMPQNTAVRIKLARLYLRYSRPDLARTQVEQVLKLNPGHAEARRLKARLTSHTE